MVGCVLLCAAVLLGSVLYSIGLMHLMDRQKDADDTAGGDAACR